MKVRDSGSFETWSRPTGANLQAYTTHFEFIAQYQTDKVTEQLLNDVYIIMMYKEMTLSSVCCYAWCKFNGEHLKPTGLINHQPAGY